jgi:hypothetical protein
MGRAEVGFDRERRIARIRIIRNHFRRPRASRAERRPGEVGAQDRAGGADAVALGLSAILEHFAFKANRLGRRREPSEAIQT